MNFQDHSTEISQGRRFGFGKNWNRFLAVLNAERISEAEKSLKEMLVCEDLAGKRFLDIGSGSGLFSLAARRLGARVCSFDYDPDSVGCTTELKGRYFPADEDWRIIEGSVLDAAFIKSLGTFDIVYSWGVLHHTGSMWQAIEHAHRPVKKGGLCFIALYNDQGRRSACWKMVKKLYCSSRVARSAIIAFFMPLFFIAGFMIDMTRLRNPLKRYTHYNKARGMSVVYDWFDWLGGYPFEVAGSEEIVAYYEQKGFQLLNMRTTRGWGNNEFVFRREKDE